MNGAELVLECLKKEGVDTLFGYPGGAVIPLYDTLYDYKKDFYTLELLMNKDLCTRLMDMQEVPERREYV